jgi:hypothetical protein
MEIWSLQLLLGLIGEALINDDDILDELLYQLIRWKMLETTLLSFIDLTMLMWQSQSMTDSMIGWDYHVSIMK